MLTEKYPNHSLSVPAFVWLVQYWSSGEAACRVQARFGARLTPGAVVRADRADTIPPAANDSALLASFSAGRDSASEANDLAGRRARAGELGQALERIDAQAWSEMHVQFPLAVARGRSPLAEVDRSLATIAGTRPHDAWWTCAAGEQWLSERERNAPPKLATFAHRTAARPRLDGQLEDDVWQQADRLELHSALADDADWPATVMLAYDQEFLFLAVSCRIAQDAEYVAETCARERDANLAMRDRIEVLLDIDRDFTTFYRLSVDYRGWTAEDCWGDATWNPRWFVAAARDDESWTIEAAIPVAELAAEAVGSNTAWAIGLQRVVPAVGFQSWTRPATVEISPEGFGYLIFD